MNKLLLLSFPVMALLRLEGWVFVKIITWARQLDFFFFFWTRPARVHSGCSRLHRASERTSAQAISKAINLSRWVLSYSAFCWRRDKTCWTEGLVYSTPVDSSCRGPTTKSSATVSYSICSHLAEIICCIGPVVHWKIKEPPLSPLTNT